MKIKVQWRQEIEGVSEIEVPEAEVAKWLNEPWNQGHDRFPVKPEDITAKDAFDWLQSGDDDVWAEQIDHERDAKALPWSDTELERLAPE